MTKIVLPTYITKLPSTGKEVSFRPFTIKEEKALLLALEENNIDLVANTIINTVKSCTGEIINPDVHPYYDIEYLFLQIRSKSVGEQIELVGTCDCGAENPNTDFSVDITTARVIGTPESNTFQIQETPYFVEMRHPTMKDFVNAFKAESNSGTETVANCIKMVYTESEEFEWSFKEKLEFVESMSPIQQTGIIKFLDSMPTVELDASFVCKHCSKEHKQILSGFENFFV